MLVNGHAHPSLKLIVSIILRGLVLSISLFSVNSGFSSKAVFNSGLSGKDTSIDLINGSGALSPCTLLTLRDHLAYFFSREERH